MFVYIYIYISVVTELDPNVRIQKFQFIRINPNIFICIRMKTWQYGVRDLILCSLESLTLNVCNRYKIACPPRSKEVIEVKLRDLILCSLESLTLNVCNRFKIA